MKTNYTVEIVIPNAGTNVDTEVREAAGDPSDYSGCCMDSGDRTHGWDGLTRAQAQNLRARLERCLEQIDEFNGFNVGGTVTVKKTR
jgi:hypothetical protein